MPLSSNSSLNHVIRYPLHHKPHSLWHDGVDRVLGGPDVVVAELHLRRVLPAAAIAAVTLGPRPVGCSSLSRIKIPANG